MRGKRVWLAGLIVLVAAACARPGTSAPGSPVRPQTPAPSATWQSGLAITAQIKDIRISHDARTVTVDDILPTMPGGGHCYRSIKTTIQSFTVDAALIGITGSLFGSAACTVPATVPIAIRLPQALGKRVLNINNSTLGDYTADAANPGQLRFCYEGVCAAPAATCDGAVIAGLVRGADVQQPATGKTDVCTQQWLVLDLSFTGGPACDNTCTPPPGTTIRMVYRATSHGWNQVVATRTDGCAPIQQAEPTFPTSLCRSLPSI